MVDNLFARLLLAPFALLYGGAIGLRNLAYRTGLLKGVGFSVPVISVGNLSVGGAGKTPHIEYLVKHFKPYIQVATLSRGYGRKTRGFLEVQPGMNAHQAGDEPLQFKRKNPDIVVAVGESRALSIPQIISRHPETQLILLDDAFQHRAVEPGLHVLLTEYSAPFTRDWLLPSGRLREWRSAYRRAHIIVISKCPVDLDRQDADQLMKEINPAEHQQVFFSAYDYGHPYALINPAQRYRLGEDWHILLVTAIARTDYLLSYLQERVGDISHLAYGDHHDFSETDIRNIIRAFGQLESEKKVVLTTEKDAIRLEPYRRLLTEAGVPVMILPIQVRFLFEEGPAFNQHIQDFLLDFKV